MKKYLLPAAAFITLIFAQNVAAYNADRTEEPCKKPRFSSFSLPEYEAEKKQEVAANSAFSFVISSGIDPTTLKLTAKKKPLPFTIEDKNSFFIVHAKVLPEHTGQFVRLDTQVHARLGCKSLDGWLIKVADK